MNWGMGMEDPDLEKLPFGAGSIPESDPETIQDEIRLGLRDPRANPNGPAFAWTSEVWGERPGLEVPPRDPFVGSGDTVKEPPPDIERVLGPFGSGTHTPDDLGEIVSQATQHTRDAVSETDLAPDWPTIEPHVSTALDPHGQDPWVTRHRVTPDGPAQPEPSPLDSNAQQAPPPFGNEPEPGGPASWGWDAPATSDAVTVQPPIASEPHPGATGSWEETDPGATGSWEWDAPVTSDAETAPAAPGTPTTSDGSQGFSAPC
jgi:hypothetical protein